MTVDELAQACQASIAVRGDEATPGIVAAYTSDLLSDVMAHAPENSVLVTVQNHLNTIAVCTLAGIRAVLVCHNREIPEDMAAAAAREGVTLLRCPLNQFEASNRVGLVLT